MIAESAMLLLTVPVVFSVPPVTLTGSAAVMMPLLVKVSGEPIVSVVTPRPPVVSTVAAPESLSVAKLVNAA